MEAEPAGFASPYPDRTYNHYLLPSGTTDDDALFSIWETREPMHAEEFAGFIDGPHSPARAAGAPLQSPAALRSSSYGTHC